MTSKPKLKTLYLVRDSDRLTKNCVVRQPDKIDAADCYLSIHPPQYLTLI